MSLDWTGLQQAEVGGAEPTRPAGTVVLRQDWGGDGNLDGWEGSSTPHAPHLLQAGAGGELVFQMVPTEGIPGLLLVEIFHLSPFPSFLKAFLSGLTYLEA